MMNRFTNPAELDVQVEELARQLDVDAMLSDVDDDWDHGQYDERWIV